MSETTIKLRVEKLIYGGAGLARLEGKAVFVPLSLPGELVEANVTEDRGSYANAELTNVLEASGDRCDAPCPYFGSCGGCHYQHADYSAQIRMKTAILREAFERARISDIPEPGTLSAEPFGYRNRVRLHVQPDPFSLCYKYRNSHRNLPVRTCPIAAPLLQSAIEVLNQNGSAFGFGAWVKEVELFVAGETQLLASFFTDRPEGIAKQALAACWPRLQKLLPAMIGVAVFSTSKTRAPGRLLIHLGEKSLLYPSLDLHYRVGFGSFFQTNRLLIDALVLLVTDGEQGDRVWDLYAGVGLFSLPLSRRFANVVAVESSSAAIRDLRENLRYGDHRIVASETAVFLRKAAEQQMGAPDLVVVDPPRAGLGRDVTASLGKIRPRKITYVSCDPSTLSRDLSSLLEFGYRLTKIHLVDLFPQTFHLESVTHLSLD